MKVLNISFGGLNNSTNCQPKKSNCCDNQLICSQGLKYDTFQGSYSSEKIAKLEKQLEETQNALNFACKILAYKGFDKIEPNKSTK